MGLISQTYPIRDRWRRYLLSYDLTCRCRYWTVLLENKCVTFCNICIVLFF